MITDGIQQLLTAYGWNVGAEIGNRVYPVTLPENPKLPAITYQVVGGQSSPGLASSGPQKLRIQFDCYGATYKSARQVREDLRCLLNGFQGPLPDGAYLSAALLIQPIDYFEQPTRQYRCSAEFYLYFNFTD